MHILMMTNTYTPHVGGVACSVERFVREYRRQGHRALVVAPVFENMPDEESDVVRVPAIQRFNGSDFSVVLPVPGRLHEAVEEFEPDLVHAHHPFLLGSTALRIAHVYGLPLVFTHHTMYERYTHYVPGDSEAMKRFAVQLSTSYANLCDQVFAPSASVADVLRSRGVTAPVDVVPTGIDVDAFAHGSGSGFRDAMGIPRAAFVVGHLGRLAREKNLVFLANAMVALAKRRADVHCLLVGSGSAESAVSSAFEGAGLSARLHRAHTLEQPLLASAYCAMDVFAFASTSETQGLVLVEAMAAMVPVVAINAPGVKEVVCADNGRAIDSPSVEQFADTLEEVASLSESDYRRLCEGARAKALEYTLEGCATRALELYRRVNGRVSASHHDEEYSAWSSVIRHIEAEWKLLKEVSEAAEAALLESSPPAPPRPPQ